MILLGDNENPNQTDYDFNELLETERELQLNEIDDLTNTKKISFDSIKNSKFFKKYVSNGKKVETILLCGVNDIEKDFSVKLFALPTNDQAELLNAEGKTWTMLRLPQNHNL